MIGLKKSYTEAIKTSSKRTIHKIAEATGDLIGKKIADKITSVSKSPKEFKNNETEAPKKRFISPHKRHQIIDELRLV